MSINKKMVAVFTIMLFVSLMFIVKPVKADTIIKNGTLASNETWVSNNIYWINGDLLIPLGVTLTIEPGTIIKFSGDTRLIINGTLSSIGDEFHRIYFTSIKDDVGEDTNGDGFLTSASKLDWGWLEFASTSSASIDFTTIRYSGDDYIDPTTPRNRGALFARDYVIPQVGANVILTDNLINGIEIPEGALPYAMNTFPFCPSAPYYLRGSLTVPQGTTLLLNPGAILKFHSESRLIVNGTLSSIGDESHQIYFTSIKDDVGGDTNGDGFTTYPNQKDWGWVEFASTSSAHIDFTTIRYSGDDYIDPTTPRNRGALFARDYVIPQISANVILTDNWKNGVEIPEGSLPYVMNTFPFYPSAPYYLRGSLTVPQGTTLLINPGAILKFQSQSRLIVNGTLSSVGDESHQIYFTSIKDDVGGDTNGDGFTTYPNQNDWGWVELESTSNASIEFTTLRYSGDDYIDPYNPRHRGAIFVRGGNCSIMNTTLTNNYSGLEAENPNNVIIHDSIIEDNEMYGIKNNTPGVWLDATNNWWGHISGPLDTSSADGLYNPYGLGDTVTDYVDYYPWTTGINYTDFIYLPMLLK